MFDDYPIAEDAGLPRCQTCNKVPLDGTTAAMKERGDVGDWISLELVCFDCGDGKKGLETVHCEDCSRPAVTVCGGIALCHECSTDQERRCHFPCPSGILDTSN